MSELDYADKLWKTADKLRGNMEPSDYKHVALGLIFLKYISDAFEARHAELLAEDPWQRKTRTNTSPTTSSGCPRMRAGRTCKPMPSNRA